VFDDDSSCATFQLRSRKIANVSGAIDSSGSCWGKRRGSALESTGEASSRRTLKVLKRFCLKFFSTNFEGERHKWGMGNFPHLNECHPEWGGVSSRDKQGRVLEGNVCIGDGRETYG